MAKYAILYNPLAGADKCETAQKKIRNALKGDELQFQDMTLITDYNDFISKISDDSRIVIMGGDGTINRFVNDTINIDIPNDIYYYPSGTGNDFMKDVGMDIKDCPFSINNYIKHLPVAVVNDKVCRFINGIGYGIDGYCCEVGDKLRLTSEKPINYSKIAIEGLCGKYAPTNAKVTVDGEEHEYKKVWLSPIMNGRYYGGGMMPTPNQDRNSKSSTLSVMVMHGSNKLKTLAIFPGIFKGNHIKHKECVEVLTGHNITVEFDRPTAAQIDGETVQGVSKIQGYYE